MSPMSPASSLAGADKAVDEDDAQEDDMDVAEDAGAAAETELPGAPDAPTSWRAARRSLTAPLDMNLR